MTANHITVKVAPNNTILIAPNTPFKSANLTLNQTLELIVALQNALDRIQKAEFIRTVSMESL